MISPLSRHPGIRYAALAAVAVIFGGGAVWEYRQFARERAVLDDLRASVGPARETLATMARSPLNLATRSNVAGAGTADAAEERAAAAMNDLIREFLGRVDQVKHWFEANPSAQIPEMRYLDEHVWIEQTASADLAAETGLRVLAANLRLVAMERFADRVMKIALNRYAAEHAGMLPSALSDLAPELPDPAASPILDRYELLVTGRADTKAASAHAIGLKPTSLADPEFDHAIYFGPASSVTYGPGSALLDIAMGRATAAYANAHNGELTEDVQQLLPYFTSPADRQRAQERQNKRDVEAASRLARRPGE